MMRIEAEEINLLDEWIFPEQKDPYVELSIKILSVLKAKVRDYNKTENNKRMVYQITKYNL